MISFSAVHTMQLSKEVPRTIPSPAWSRSAVASTTQGGLPGPAATARFPEFIAARTTSPPPVTATRRTSGWVITPWAEAMVGGMMAVSTLGGPPAPTMQSLNAWIVSPAIFLANGCTLNTTVFPPAIMAMPLLVSVSVALVHGVMLAMTPNAARSMSVMPLSPVRTSAWSASVPWVLLAASLFLMILWSTRPRPVSSTARRAIISALSLT